jgi:phosphoenolpyruvate carboxykinase (ATP)
MIDALLKGELADVPFETDPVFGLSVPLSCPNVPEEALQPRRTWQNPTAYDEQARKLAKMFVDNFKQFADGVPPEVLSAGPTL